MGRFNIVFMGTPEFAVPALKRLFDGPDVISAVVTQPDRPKGRGRKLVFSPVKKVALDAGIRIFQPLSVKDHEFIDKIRGLSPDLFVVAAFGQILPEELLDVPEIMPINIHGSILPALRGAAPVQWAILQRLPETGITIMKMDKGMDTGDILLQKRFPIEEEETAGSLYEKMADTGAVQLMKALDLLEKGELEAVKQPEKGVTYAPPFKKDIFHLDWDLQAVDVHSRIRAFDPAPGAWTEWNGHRIRLFHPFFTGISVPVNVKPGTVIDAGDKGIRVATSDYILGIREIQFPGKKRMSCADFLRGKGIKPGERFG